ncbi:hypothetical protein ACP4OV_023850 [Aristida adscensionis]
MMSTTQDVPISASRTANSPVVAMDAKLVVATEGFCGCNQSKDLQNKLEDATTMAATTSTSSNQATAKSSRVSIHPLLLAAACKGNWDELHFLLNRADAQTYSYVTPSQEFLEQLAAYSSSDCTNGSLALRQATADIEEGMNTPVLSAASLLEGVTIEGDAALHVVAANGDSENFLRCVNLIYGMAKNLLYVLNNNGDTPLHCASRAETSRMVSLLIDLARREDCDDKITVKDFMRKENSFKETALNEAIRIGNNHIVEVLMAADSELATFPKAWTSPLYQAIMLENDIVAQTLYNKSKGNALSYAGPNGQNALHAAVLRGKVVTKVLLEWNKSLTTQRDENGSTPLHFAATVPQQWLQCSQVFEANPGALYQSDHDGLFPIHVAAAVGAKRIIIMFINKCGSSAGLCDSKGRTFLHVAIQKKRVGIVSFACRNQSLTWILNMRDKDGNTALHLAVQAGSFRMFCALLGNRHVKLNLTNAKGETPLDISRNKIPPGIHYIESSEERICSTLTIVGAMRGASRQDHFQDNYEDIHQLKSNGEIRELDKLKDSTKTLCIGSVLIATVAFSATFALPGGYRADDHMNGGTPTLAGRYIFDAFMIAIALAFICSAIATIGLIFSGVSMTDLRSRQIYYAISIVSVSSSVTSLTAAFALGVYMVLAPVAHNTAIAICVISPIVLLSGNLEYWWRWTVLVRPLCTRKGVVSKALMLSATEILAYAFLEFWSLIFIFSWAAIARNHQRH